MKIWNRRQLTMAAMALAVGAYPAHAGAVLDRVMAAGTLKVATDANWSYGGKWVMTV
ncbi:hypothetical protein [Mesorhizobium qingshengii]|uniref:Polar amino acid transport system substrate-binding protein n=1 Tax=Mesorhizobium qingshengii TaxID=1165689 RepID=A0A1G5ZYL2_9HYPH|nr:hypothetical protein [Mesorhizobium qingshengii]SDA99737.1 polar amino acid transport system substrate-binding protein [Mesorhizobium qingshengii]